MRPCKIHALAWLGLLASFVMTEAQADFQTFESTTPANNSTVRSNWLAAAGVAAPQHLVNFEVGFTNNENISGVSGLFPGGLVISDSSPAHAATVRSGAGVIGNSNPVGNFSLTQNEQPYLELIFDATPVNYVGFLEIDQAGTTGIVTFVGGTTATFSFATTASSGDSAQFFGIFRNDRPQITRVQLDASGDGIWGLDNIEYGARAVPEPASVLLLSIGVLTLVCSRLRRQSNTA